MKLKSRTLTALFLSLCLVVFMAGSAVSQDISTPETLKGGKIISVEKAKELFDNKAAVFFDVRSPINYGRGHIPVASSLAFKGKVEKSVDFIPAADSLDNSKLPDSKEEPMVFYSHGPTGWKSYLSAFIAIEMGYKNVMWFRGGYSQWVESGYQSKSGR